MAKVKSIEQPEMDTLARSEERLTQARNCVVAVMVLLILGVFPMLLLRNNGSLISWELNYSYSGFTQAKRDTMWLISGLCTVLGTAAFIMEGFELIRWKDPARILGALFFGWMIITAYCGS